MPDNVKYMKTFRVVHDHCFEKMQSATQGIVQSPIKVLIGNSITIGDRIFPLILSRNKEIVMFLSLDNILSFIIEPCAILITLKINDVRPDRNRFAIYDISDI